MIKRIALIMHKENVSRRPFGLMGHKRWTAPKDFEVEKITQPGLFLLAAQVLVRKKHAQRLTHAIAF